MPVGGRNPAGSEVVQIGTSVPDPDHGSRRESKPGIRCRTDEPA